MGLSMDRRSHRIAAQAAFALGVLACWQLAHLFWMPGTIPSPLQTVEAFQVQLFEEDLVGAMTGALGAILAGYLLAIVVGVPIGVLMGTNQWAESALNPYLTALYVTPFAALIPALIIWFGTGLQIRVFTVFFFAILPIAINTYDGARDVPRELVEAAESFGGGKLFIAKNVVIPHEVPYLMAGLRIGISMAVKGLVVTELLVSITGFGQIISRWSTASALEGVFSVVIVLMALGITMTWLLRRAERRLVTWETA